MTRSPRLHLIVLGLLGSCSSTEGGGDASGTLCTPGSTRTCSCSGAPGTERCNGAGTAFGACVCPAEGGAKGDVVRPADAVRKDGPASTSDLDLATGPLPEGATGIASKYKNDVGITSDLAVIFADTFESYASASGLSSTWDDVYQAAQTSIATVAANVFRGQKALEFTVPKQSAELSNTVAKRLAKQLDVLFLRYYSKFDAGFDVLGSSHNGSVISAHYYVNGQATPGVPANGTNKFLAAFESWRGESTTPNPGEMNVYVYHPEQRSQWGDHFFPTGEVMPNTSIPFDFGPSFVKRAKVVPKLGQWYAYEFMVKANTPGKRDGRIACWMDGKLIADFPNLRLRDVATLKIDRFDLSLHVGSNTAAVAKKWYDNVVAATSYIGPVSE